MPYIWQDHAPEYDDREVFFEWFDEIKAKRLAEQQKPGMFRSFREFAWAFMWVWAPVIAVIIWRIWR